MKRIKARSRLVAVICVCAFVAGMCFAPRPSRAFDFGDILKGAGVAVVVSQFGNQIDHFINSALGQRGIEAEGMTKVVPVVGIGNGTAIGAVQVVGPATQVEKVQAVAEVELHLGNVVRARALIPVTTQKVETNSVRGVGGVGVLANIKTPL